jgi:hypothetical protein
VQANFSGSLTLFSVQILAFTELLEALQLGRNYAYQAVAISAAVAAACMDCQRPKRDAST